MRLLSLVFKWTSLSLKKLKTFKIIKNSLIGNKIRFDNTSFHFSRVQPRLYCKVSNDPGYISFWTVGLLCIPKKYEGSAKEDAKGGAKEVP